MRALHAVVRGSQGIYFCSFAGIFGTIVVSLGYTAFSELEFRMPNSLGFESERRCGYR